MTSTCFLPALTPLGGCISLGGCLTQMIHTVTAHDHPSSLWRGCLSGWGQGLRTLDNPHLPSLALVPTLATETSLAGVSPQAATSMIASCGDHP